jgi:transcriptional regulator with XRE-family HTH domain
MAARRKRESLQELLATNVRINRRLRRWTQEDLAERALLHRTQVGAIERGEKDVRLSTLEKLGHALEVSASDLIQTRVTRP